MTQHAAAREPAIGWARRHVDFDEQQIVTDTPWATTWRLHGSDGPRAYLKRLPQHLAHATHAMPILSRLCGPVVTRPIASDHEQRLVLFDAHGGHDLPRKANDAQREQMLATYAGIQCRARGQRDLLETLPACEPSATIDRFLAFLDPDTAQAAPLVGARHFLGARDAATYHELVVTRRELLAAYVGRANALDDTINHLDLRPNNAALTDDGQCIIYDWDEAVRGPAGLSLHAMFGGALAPVLLLDDQRERGGDPGLEALAPRLDAYVQGLVDGGYATREQLSFSLGASALAGMLHFLTSFTHYPGTSPRYRKTIAGNMRKRLSDLLDVCDVLTSRADDAGAVLDMARRYREYSRTHRAYALLDSQLERSPGDTASICLKASLLRGEGKPGEALGMLEAALVVSPGEVAVLAALVAACAECGRYASAARHLESGLALAPDDEALQRLSRHLGPLREATERADRPGKVPKVALGRRRHPLQRAAVSLAETLFRRYGVLQLNGLFERSLLRTCHAAFLDDYRDYLDAKRPADALRLGDRRLQVTLEFKPPFDAEALSANRLLSRLMRELLGDTFVLGAMTCSMSLPGAATQRLHKDHSALFPERADLEGGPPFAISVMVPLIDIDETVGTTRVRKGSHRYSTHDSGGLPSQSPIVRLGSCYLMDYRLSHYGQANRSSTPRPIINMVFQRPWFRDSMNFHGQPAVRVDAERFERLGARQRRLLGWTQEPAPGRKSGAG